MEAQNVRKYRLCECYWTWLTFIQEKLILPLHFFSFSWALCLNALSNSSVVSMFWFEVMSFNQADKTEKSESQGFYHVFHPKNYVWPKYRNFWAIQRWYCWVLRNCGSMDRKSLHICTCLNFFINGRSKSTFKQSLTNKPSCESTSEIKWKNRCCSCVCL